ncbi:MAG: hypothetical protein V1837_03850 [Candidatus Woesearchaeota archaeon]
MEFVNSTSGPKVDELLFEYIQQQFTNSMFGEREEDPEKIKKEIINSIESLQKPKSMIGGRAVTGQEIIDSMESAQKQRRQPDYKKVLPRMPQYYYNISAIQKPQEYFFVYTPAGITIMKVSQAQLGHGVLGVAYPGAGVIKIADHLFGLDFEEVKKHEVLHIMYPFLTEFEIRQKTKSELPFETRYH